MKITKISTYNLEKRNSIEHTITIQRPNAEYLEKNLDIFTPAFSLEMIKK